MVVVSHRVRLVLQLALALVVLGALMPGIASAQEAPPPVELGGRTVTTGGGLVPTVRFAGVDRFETAAKIADEFGPELVSPGTDAAILARADIFPDALAGSYLSGLIDAPILLTGTETLDQTTANKLNDLDVSTVYVLGSTAAIAEQVETTLEQQGYTVVRFGGAERNETAAIIATDSPGATVGTLDGQRTAILARNEEFPDALVAGNIASSENFPLLLTAPDQLSEVTEQAIAELGIERVIIAGGPNAVQPGVEAELLEGESITVTRIFGATRVETAVEFARFEVAELGYRTDEAALARGDLFPDALALSAFAGREEISTLLTPNPETLGDATREYFEELSSCSFNRLFIAGGVAAITEQTEQEAREALTPDINCDENLEGLFIPGVSPIENAVGELNGDDPDTITLTYTVPAFCTGEDPGQFTYIDSDNEPVAAIGLECNGTETVLLTFPDGTLDPDDEGIVRYVQSSNPDNRIKDREGNPALSPDEEPVTIEDEGEEPTPPPPGEDQADLSVIKSAQDEEVTEGENVTFVVRAINDGPDEATGVTITDDLPDNVTFVDASEECDESGGTVTCDIGTLVDSEFAEVEITVRADEAGEIRNTATIEGNEDDPDGDNNSSTEVVTVNEDEEPPPDSADLSIQKTARPRTVQEGDRVTFTITVQNNGPDDATGVTITDDLPNNVTFVSASDACEEDGGTVTCELGDIREGDGDAVFITVGTEGGNFTNTATVDGDQDDPEGGNNSDSATVTVNDRQPGAEADLAIDKTADMDTVTEGDTITFTIDVTNNGPDDAEDVRVVDDITSDNATFVSASGDAMCTQEDPGGPVVCEFDIVADGTTETVELVFRTDDESGGDTVANTATVDSSADDPDESDNTDDATVAVENRQANLSITKTASMDTVTEGDTITFTIEVTNNGPDDAMNVTVFDTFTENATFVEDDSPDGVECFSTSDPPGESPVVCEFETVAEGETETVILTFVADVDMDTQDEVLINDATVDSGADDPDESDNTASDRVTIIDNSP